MTKNIDQKHNHSVYECIIVTHRLNPNYRNIGHSAINYLLSERPKL